MDIGSELLSEIVYYRTYSQTKADGKKETRTETINRVRDMHVRKFPAYKSEIESAFEYVHAGLVVPSMRSMQFGGDAIERANARMYNCFAVETEFLTRDGIKRFSDFADGDVIDVLADKNQWKPATVRCFGKQRLMKLVIRRGKAVETIYCTDNHRWIVVDKSTGGGTRRIVETQNLIGGEVFATQGKTINLETVCSVGLQHGIVFGDGTYDKVNRECRIDLRDDSQEFVDHFTTGCRLKKDTKGGVISDRSTYITKLPYNWKQLPALTANISYLAGFLKGWIAADGCVVAGGQITLASSTKEHLEWARSAFALLGAQTSQIRISRKVSPFDGSDKPLYSICVYKGALPKSFFIRSSHANNFSELDNERRWKVESVEWTDRVEDVWCVQEPDTECFTLSQFVLTKNCAFLNLTNFKCFADLFYLLMCGCGTGYSVQKRHIEQLPSIKQGNLVYAPIEDTKEGWADSVLLLLECPRVVFDYSLIRKAGERLSTGGLASGPDALVQAHRKIRLILFKALGRQLTTLECHDIMCFLAEAVVVGGVRRAALISLMTHDDNEMLTCKSGNWWVDNPQRARANNSAVLLRTHPDFDVNLQNVLFACFESGAGEPGVFLTDDYEWGVNPCVPAGTQILTRDGYYNIEQLVGVPTDVWNGFEWSTVTPAVTGYDQPLVKVTLRSGQALTCTEAHKFVLADGTRKNAVDLRVGDKLIKTAMPVIEQAKYEGTQPNVDPYTQGFYSGDGTDGKDYIYVYEPKYACLGRLKGIRGVTDDGRVRVRGVDVIREKNWVPMLESLDFRLNWFAGLLDSDGTELIEGGAQICAVDKEFLLSVQKMLTTCGVTSKIVKGHEARRQLMPDGYGGTKAYDCSPTFRLCIGAVQMQSLKSLGLRCERMSFNKTPQRDASQFVRVSTVEEAGYADVVYCFTEPLRNMGTFEGIVTGQCAEISLRGDGQMCVAGDTKLITKTGITTIKDAVGQTIEIWNGEQWSEVTPFSTGKDRKLLRVTLSDGSYLDCTDNHRFSVRDRFMKTYREVQAKDLKDVSRYALHTQPYSIEYTDGTTIQNAYTLGAVIGDGFIQTRSTGGTRIGVDLYGDKDFAMPVEGTRGKRTRKNGYNVDSIRVSCTTLFGETERQLIRAMKAHSLSAFESMFSWDRKSILEFFAGWIDADGSSTRSGGIRLYISGAEKTRLMQLLLTKCGIRSSSCFAAPKGAVTNYGTRAQDLCYLQITDCGSIPCKRVIVSNGHVARFKGKHQNIVSVVEIDGLHDTYCFEEPLKHMGVFANVLTYQCNLTEVNVAACEDEDAFLRAVLAATLIGTLQASYTDFTYLQPAFKINCEKDALLGVSLTGQAENWDLLHTELLHDVARGVRLVNSAWADALGINPAARIGCVKPSGTTSAFLGTTSGIHAAHAPYYLRRVRLDKLDPIATHLMKTELLWAPESGQFLEQDKFIESNVIVTLPVNKRNAIQRADESSVALMERSKHIYENWILPTHNDGANPHNVSLTVSYKQEEIPAIIDWMIANKDCYSGISLLPFSEHSYVQAPFEEITHDQYMAWLEKLPVDLDLTAIDYSFADDTRGSELACGGGGSCEYGT